MAQTVSDPRRTWVVAALSLAVHAALVLLLLRLGGRLPQALEPPPVTVSIIDMPRPQARTVAESQRRPTVRLHRTVQLAPAPAYDAPQAQTPTAADLFAAPFADVRKPKAAPPPIRPCPPPGAPDQRRHACERDEAIAAAVARSGDPNKARDGEFAAEARRNEAMKRYHELPGDAGYPGLGCALLHRC